MCSCIIHVLLEEEPSLQVSGRFEELIEDESDNFAN